MHQGNVKRFRNDDGVFRDDGFWSPKPPSLVDYSRNPKGHKMSLFPKNPAGEFQTLPHITTLDAKLAQVSDIPDVHLSNFGDTTALLYEWGLKFDGVGYRSQQGVGRQPFAIVRWISWSRDGVEKNVPKSMMRGLI